MFCGIDFGTSNSAVALDTTDDARLLMLGARKAYVPTAVFVTNHGQTIFADAALHATENEDEGRLFRSIKSVLPTDLYDEVASVAPGIAMPFQHLISAFLAHLRKRAQEVAGRDITRAVVGRPVRFSTRDDHDARAERRLRDAAHAAGFEDVQLVFEPIAAALDYERTLDREAIALVADLGGGTSDFAAIRLGPQRHRALDRGADALAATGVYTAGTDVDRQIDLRAIMPMLGLGGSDVDGGPIPSKIYFELATWHLLNFAYKPSRVREIDSWRRIYRDAAAHRRLMHVLEHRLGNQLLAEAERAKVALSDHAHAALDLGVLDAGLSYEYARDAYADDIASIVDAIESSARECVRQSGIAADEFDVVIFTGGTSSIGLIAQAIQRVVPQAQAVVHDRFGGVARGLARLGRLREEQGA